jgi:hypothetical protein
MRSKPGPHMSLANMRQNGVRAVIATCEACNHSADGQRRRPARDRLRAPRRPTLPMQQLRRQGDQHPAAWHLGPQNGFRPRHSAIN